MAKNLVIVESPSKAKTLEGFLGKDYKVVSSYGHIADLPSKDIGVDLETFSPKYVVSEDKKPLIKTLKKLVDSSQTVWLASDEDREGEAIAWHLSNQLKLEATKTKRIVFNSITKRAVLNAINNPRPINYNLVDAQQARRVLDRLVGYELSPVLWKKVRRGLSAGRVQSVTVRLVVEREREIENFDSNYVYKVSAIFVTSAKKSFKAQLKETFKTEQEAKDFIEKNINTNFTVSNLEVKPVQRYPAAPFTTSTLQQEASRKLGFSVSRTMRVAQRLYESGHITYMRTDSNNLSPEAINSAKEVIEKLYGAPYSNPKRYNNKSKGAQEAHEAIRPTYMINEKINVEAEQSKLYNLIWKRTIASQMSTAKLEQTNLEISADAFSEKYLSKGEVITFDGFLKVYLEGHDDEEDEKQGILPKLKKGDNLTYHRITATQKFARPPARYTEASLVKQLEKLGIGRPSTYAPTISTVQNRGYVERGENTGSIRDYTQIMLSEGAITKEQLSETTGGNKGKLIPTHIGKIVNDFLVQNFESILDYNFTAKVEQSFDDIAEGNKNWQGMMKHFYDDFHPVVKHVEETSERQSGERILGTDPESGKPVSVRLGKYGPMAQIGTRDDENIRFSSLMPSQSIDHINLEEALNLFKLPRHIGAYKGKDIISNSGRYGQYIKFGDKYISVPSTKNIFTISLEEAIELVKEKELADAPITQYKSHPVTKGKGRFGPFIKWDGIFINVSKKYDFDNLSQEDIAQLIEAKLKKEAEKIIKVWEFEGIRIEKARWQRFNIIQGKKKVELPKETEIDKITLEQAQELLSRKKRKALK